MCTILRVRWTILSCKCVLCISMRGFFLSSDVTATISKGLMIWSHPDILSMIKLYHQFLLQPYWIILTCLKSCRKLHALFYQNLRKIEWQVSFSFQFHWLFRLRDSLIWISGVFLPPAFAFHYLSALNVIKIFKMSLFWMHQLTMMILLPPLPQVLLSIFQKFNVWACGGGGKRDHEEKKTFY